MRRLALILIALFALPALWLLAETRHPHGPPFGRHAAIGHLPAAIGRAEAQDFRPLPFHELAGRVHDRYRGRLVGAGMSRPTPAERDLGAALVYEFRLLTPQRNLLRIRMDARSGRFLEIAGRGQLQALRPPSPGDHSASGEEDDDDRKEN